MATWRSHCAGRVDHRFTELGREAHWSRASRHSAKSADLTNVGSAAKRWEKLPYKVPVPCISAKSGSRVFQWLELEPFGREPDRAPVGKEAFAVCRNKMGHRVTLPSMTVEPESTVHCEDHPVEAVAEFAECQGGFSGHAILYHPHGL